MSGIMELYNMIKLVDEQLNLPQNRSSKDTKTNISPDLNAVNRSSSKDLELEQIVDNSKNLIARLVKQFNQSPKVLPSEGDQNNIKWYIEEIKKLTAYKNIIAFQGLDSLKPSNKLINDKYNDADITKIDEALNATTVVEPPSGRNDDTNDAPINSKKSTESEANGSTIPSNVSANNVDIYLYPFGAEEPSPYDVLANKTKEEIYDLDEAFTSLKKKINNHSEFKIKLTPIEKEIKELTNQFNEIVEEALGNPDKKKLSQESRLDMLVLKIQPILNSISELQKDFDIAMKSEEEKQSSIISRESEAVNSTRSYKDKLRQCQESIAFTSPPQAGTTNVEHDLRNNFQFKHSKWKHVFHTEANGVCVIKHMMDEKPGGRTVHLKEHDISVSKDNVTACIAVSSDKEHQEYMAEAMFKAYLSTGKLAKDMIVSDNINKYPAMQAKIALLLKGEELLQTPSMTKK